MTFPGLSTCSTIYSPLMSWVLDQSPHQEGALQKKEGRREETRRGGELPQHCLQVAGRGRARIASEAESTLSSREALAPMACCAPSLVGPG